VSGVVVHPTALVGSAEIGAGTRVWAFSNVLAGARVGRNCNIGDHCYVEGGAVVGDDVTIKNGNAIWEGVTLEDGVFVGPGVLFTNDLYPRSPRLHEAARRYEGRDWLVRTRVRRGASLGAGAVVICGVVVGEYALVAAGSTVTSDVPAHALVAGSPARQRGWVCACGERVHVEDDVAACADCGAAYVLADDRLSLAAQPPVVSGNGSGRDSR
jgi:acetyltransferase-like isoleucine patch superfamily enzyme